MTRSFLAATGLLLCAVPALAVYSVSDTGRWPKTWPKKLEPLRLHARTLQGPIALSLHYAIRFTSHKEFVADWPSILSLKTKDAPIFIVHGANFFLGDGVKAGVIIHTPPTSEKPDPVNSPVPIPNETNEHTKWMHATYLEVLVDDDVITRKSLAAPEGTVFHDSNEEKK